MTKAMAAMLAKAIEKSFVVAVVREKRLVALKLDAEGLLWEVHAGTFKPTDKAYADAGLTPPRVCHLAGDAGTLCGQTPAPTSWEPAASWDHDHMRDFGMEPCSACMAKSEAA